MKRRVTFLWLTVNICRLLLGAVFLFSGFVKAVDPVGTSYKLGEYFAAFGWGAFTTGRLPLLLAVGQAVFEFLLGTYLLWGMRRRLIAIVTFIVMAGFAVFTLYIALAHPVADCGCFGDAVHLSNWQTFAKNVVLLVCAAVVLRWARVQSPRVPRTLKWVVALYSLLFVLGVALYSVQNLPVIDFRPYRVGATLRPEPSVTVEPTYILEKNGEQRRFTAADYPDSTWTFVGIEPAPASANDDLNETLNFVAFDADGNDVTEPLLTDPNYAFWLITGRLESTDDSAIDRINEVQDYARRYGYRFCVLTCSSEPYISEWAAQEGLNCPFYQVDADVLRTMVRSNPALMLVKNGIVYAKWSDSRFPGEHKLRGPLHMAPPTPVNAALALMKWLMFYLLPIVAVLLLYLVGRKQKKQTIKPQNNLNMRKKIVAGNWKMNMNLPDGVALARELQSQLEADKPQCDVIICTPFIHLASIAAFLNQDLIGLGAENCADKEKGAYTGEVSAEMVKSTGARYVILGHSERRGYYNETPAILKEKVALALKNGLKIIFCIGESLEEREAGKQNEVVKAELEGSVFSLSADEFKNIIIAYEPIWAIGTGKTATAEQAEEIHAYIRQVIAQKFGDEVAQDTTILYGGSCKPSNAAELFAKPDIDGGLIGGASLKAADFKGIIDAWKK